MTSSLVLALAVGAGCRIEKEPLRAGWLASGVYEDPPRPRCPPSRAPGRTFDELDRWRPPSLRGSAEVRLTLPWSGNFSADVRTAGAKGTRTRVSSKARRPIRVVEDRGVTEQIPGFIAGIDLRAYRRIAFIVDTSSFMCDTPSCPDGQGGTNIPAAQLQIAGDQVDAAVSGLRSDQWFVVYGGSSRREMRFQPASPQGRALAGQFVRGQVCSGNRGVRGQMLRALEDSVDVMVVMTDGYPQQRRNNDYERRYQNCQIAPSMLYCYVDDQSEAVNMRQIADGKRLPPVIAVSISRHDATWLENLAEATGGAYADMAP